MTITSVAVTDTTNPVEVQAWFDSNPGVAIVSIWNSGNTFFIVYSR